MWLARIARLKKKAVRIPPRILFRLNARKTAPISGATYAMVIALELCPAAMIMKLYEANVKPMAPTSACHGFNPNERSKM